MDVNIDVQKVFDDLDNMPPGTRHFVAEGATRSGKTYSIIQWLIFQCINNKNLVVRCYRKDGSTHRENTIKDFLEIIHKFHLYSDACWNKSSSIFTFKNGSTFSFNATNDPQKLHGRKADISWLEEAMEISWDAYTQINFRTTGLIIFSFNPSISQHWVFDRIIPLANTCYSHSTYLDNTFLTPEQIAAIESYNPEIPQNIINQTACPWKWAVYGLGKRGKLPGSIYPLFQKIPYAEFPQREICQAFLYGCDLGFADPLALVEVRIFHNDVYIRELIYESGLNIVSVPNDPDIPSLQGHLECLGISKHDMIICDGAAAENISSLRACGYTAIAQGKKDVLWGIDIVKQYRIYIDDESLNAIASFEQYAWKKNPQGETVQIPEHKWSHIPDAVRYAVTRVHKNINSGPKQTIAKGSIIERIQGYSPPKKSDGLLTRRTMRW